MAGMKTLAMLTTLALFPLQCFGWGGIGHRTTGLIAETKLEPAARAAVAELLGSETLSSVASWADSLRSHDGYSQTSWYHFEKIPDGESFLGNLRSIPDWQKEKGGIVGAILLANHLLRDPSLPRAEQVDALKFLVHFVGDIHQPLHTGRPEDKGGLTIQFDWMGSPSNLHKLWDSTMILTGHPDLAAGKKPEALIARDYALFLEARHGKETIALTMNVEGWLNESQELRLSAYEGDFRHAQSEYQKKHLPVIDQRIYTSGVRLAALLNDIYARRSTPESEHSLWKAIDSILGGLRRVITFRP